MITNIILKKKLEQAYRRKDQNEIESVFTEMYPEYNRSMIYDLMLVYNTGRTDGMKFVEGLNDEKVG